MSKGKRKKKYIPKSPLNPVVQQRRLDKINIALDNHRKDMRAVSRSYDMHISYLSNFTRHDIKNAILNIGSILSTTEPGEFTEEVVKSLQTHLDIIGATIDNFSKLVPYSPSGKFTLSTLMIAVETLTRADMQKHNIDMQISFPKKSEIEIELPFHTILQMLNNLFINAIKSLENTETKRITIISSLTEDDNIRFEISDNGAVIEEIERPKIFVYGYSTTGGSGIGLYHAKYLCDQFKGKISVDLHPDKDMNKTFYITLPLKEPNGEDCTDS